MSAPAPGPEWFSTQLIAAVVGVALGFLLSEAKDWALRRRRRRAHWAALRAELDLCKEAAEMYLGDKVAAPTYRLPVVAYENALPSLLSEGVVSKEQAVALTKFFMQVETLNRGLDQSQLAHQAHDAALLADRRAVGILKAKTLVPGTAASPTLYDQARAAVDPHL